MKIAIIFTFLAFISASKPLVKADDILGVWTTGNAKSQVQIYKVGDRYFGKIIKLKDPFNEQGEPKVDFRNPDASKQSQPLIGLNVLRGLKFDGKEEWNDGRIYNPEDGKDYKCLMRLETDKKLTVRGYIGISAFGKSQTWTR